MSLRSHFDFYAEIINQIHEGVNEDATQIDSSPSHNAASCQPRSQCPLRTLGTRLASGLNKLPPPLSFAPPANAAPKGLCNNYQEGGGGGLKN